MVLILAFGTQEAFSQTISGLIDDENNVGLPGVLVQLDDDFTKGAVTDIDGRYTIKNVAGGTYKLQFSFLGYKTQSIQIEVFDGQDLTVNFKMEPETDILDEVVVVGYGVQRKRDVTGTIATVDSRVVTAMPTPSFEASLQGAAPGVQVTQGSGLAGSASIVRVRGIASISAGGDPLYVVDGIPITQDNFLLGNTGGMNTNPLSSINPNDIESIDILKDASATGIYGSRGANGVILVTTKRGKSKGLKFNFTSRVGTSQPTALPNMLNSEQYLQLYQEAYENDGGVGLAPLPGGISWEDARNTNTDWVDLTTRTGIKQMYSFGATKGGENYNLYANLTYDNNESYLVGNNLERLSGRFNLDYQVLKNLKIKTTSSLSRANNNRVDAAWAGGLGAAMSTALPIYSPYTPDSSGAPEYTRGVNNPLININEKTWRQQELRGLFGLGFEYNPFENAFINVNGGYDYMTLSEDIYEGSSISNDPNIGAVAKRRPLWVSNFNISATGNYLYKPSDDNKFNFMVGSEFQRSHTGQYNSFEYILADGPLYKSTPNEENRRDGTGVRQADQEFIFISYFGRVNYSYKDKYILQGTLRTDGSSRFGENNKFGLFPSASAGWIISDESFWNFGFANYAKMKASFGRTGNANIPNNEFRGVYQGPSPTYNGQPSLYPTNLPNPNLQWETSDQFDIGLELGFFQDRIFTELSYYYKNSTDILMNLNVPPSVGFSTYWDNLGRIVNEGVELNIKSRNLVKAFKWITDLNLAYNYNEIKSIGEYEPEAISGGTNDTRVVVGEPVGTNFLVRFSHVDPETGKPVYLDINGNETFTWTPNDRVAVGNVLPDLVGGITNTFSYKNLDLAMVVTFQLGADIYDSSSKRQLGVVTDWNMREDIFDRWRQPGDIAKYPRLTRSTETYGSGTPWINTDLWLHDGSYARLRRISLGYNFNNFAKYQNRTMNLRIEASATNILTVTSFIGLDPEIARDFENAADRNLSANIIYLTPPQEKTYNLSVNLTF